MWKQFTVRGNTQYVVNRDPLAEAVFIWEPGLYELVFKSKLPIAENFRDWVFSKVLPFFKIYGQYKLLANPNNHMIMIGNKTDLHYKEVDLIKTFYPDSLLIASFGELQDGDEKRLDSC